MEAVYNLAHDFHMMHFELHIGDYISIWRYRRAALLVALCGILVLLLVLAVLACCCCCPFGPCKRRLVRAGGKGEGVRLKSE